MKRFFEILDEIKGWNPTACNALVYELLKAKKIEYTEITKMYVKDLEEDNQKKNQEIMPLAMHLSMAVFDNIDKKLVAKLIYEKKYFETAPIHEELKKFLKQ